MFIAVDVGNSNIHLGIFNESRIPKLIKTYQYPCNQKGKAQFITFIKNQKKINGLIISDAYGKTSIMKLKGFKKITSQIPNFILLTPETDCGLKINYQPKSSLGTDRIANCIATHTIYQKDCLIIDFGTATTFNVVSKQGEFLGGLILPGIKMMFKSYPQHLIKRHKLKIKRPGVLEISTSQAINSGLYYSIISAIIMVKKEMEKQLKTKLYTIATGNGINLIPNLKTIFDNIDEHLTLRGLSIIYHKNNRRREK